ncbi:MAG TPA: DUF4062 domain-containing protein [Polyangiaceae bacterium]|nr:DUF4062 domain-containing protein [Polyangiaceae bacterium]
MSDCATPSASFSPSNNAHGLSNSVQTAAGPRIFVSSTIYDFRDLRSALKFWLVELGYDVQMSEHADFGKSLDTNSHDACLRAIDDCDYFVLFIGARVGGMYDESQRLSITRAEYQHAYARFKAGHLRIVPFVRKEVWDIRSDRKALADYLRSDAMAAEELSANAVEKIRTHPSKFATDANAIFSFIDEVSRAEEMKAAIRSGVARPEGNWVHVFDSFSDVAAVLRQSIGLTTNVRRRGLVANVMHEIAFNLRAFLVSKDGVVSPTSSRWTRIREELMGQLRADIVGSSSIDAIVMNTFCACWLEGQARHLQTTFLEEALRSGQFLEYNRARDAIEVGAEQDALLQLLDEVRGYARLSQSISAGPNLFGAYASKNAESKTTVKNADLFVPIALLDSEVSLVRRLKATFRSLANGTWVSDVPRTANVPARLATVFEVSVRQMPTLVEVRQWLDEPTDAR